MHFPSSGHLLTDVRQEGYLILSGGLTIHTFEDFGAYNEKTAKPIFKSFDQAVFDAMKQPSVRALNEVFPFDGLRSPINRLNLESPLCWSSHSMKASGKHIHAKSILFLFTLLLELEKVDSQE